jgi:26S proteasome regulatory subunit N3
MEVDGAVPVPSPKLRAARAEKPLIPEVDAYLHLLVLLRLIDTEKVSESRECSGRCNKGAFRSKIVWLCYFMSMRSSMSIDKQFHCTLFGLFKKIYKHNLIPIISDLLMHKLKAYNRRSLDLVAAKCYFYFSRAYELDKRMEQIRPTLYARLRTATLRNDYEGQAVLINCLLRNYLHYNLYDQVQKWMVVPIHGFLAVRVESI